LTRISGSRTLVVASVIAAVMIGSGCGDTRPKAEPVASTTTTTRAPAHVRKPVRARLVPALPVPAPLYAKSLDIRAGPVPVAIQLRIPSIHVDATVLGVGVLANDVMDAPEGRINDPVWQQAFWYRGSAVPGVPSTAVIAGHINGPRGTQGVFGHIDQLRPGDQVVVHDPRSRLDVRFAVTRTADFTLAQTTDKAVLREIYGVGPVAGTTPQTSADKRAHLTLITCAGNFDTRLGTHDHRLAVFAVRVA
jgi:sortase (surface protein transpeptidase)